MKKLITSGALLTGLVLFAGQSRILASDGNSGSISNRVKEVGSSWTKTGTATKETQSNASKAPELEELGHRYSPAYNSRATQHVTHVANRYHENKMVYGHSYKGRDGRVYKYDHCPTNLQRYCRPATYHNWSKYSWMPKYNCSGYYCGEAKSWYYWCEPRCCYLPVSYIEQYPSCEPAETCEQPVVVQQPVYTPPVECQPQVPECRPERVVKVVERCPERTTTVTRTTVTTTTTRVKTCETPVITKRVVCETPYPDKCVVNRPVYTTVPQRTCETRVIEKQPCEPCREGGYPVAQNNGRRY